MKGSAPSALSTTTTTARFALAARLAAAYSGRWIRDVASRLQRLSAFSIPRPVRTVRSGTRSLMVPQKGSRS